MGSLIELKNHTLMIDALELLKAKHKNIKMKFLGVGVDEKIKTICKVQKARR